MGDFHGFACKFIENGHGIDRVVRFAASGVGLLDIVIRLFRQHRFLRRFQVFTGIARILPTAHIKQRSRQNVQILVRQRIPVFPVLYAPLLHAGVIVIVIIDQSGGFVPLVRPLFQRFGIVQFPLVCRLHHKFRNVFGAVETHGLVRPFVTGQSHFHIEFRLNGDGVRFDRAIHDGAGFKIQTGEIPESFGKLRNLVELNGMTGFMNQRAAHEIFIAVEHIHANFPTVIIIITAASVAFIIQTESMPHFAGLLQRVAPCRRFARAVDHAGQLCNILLRHSGGERVGKQPVALPV